MPIKSLGGEERFTAGQKRGKRRRTEKEQGILLSNGERKLNFPMGRHSVLTISRHCHEG